MERDLCPAVTVQVPGEKGNVMRCMLAAAGAPMVFGGTSASSLIYMNLLAGQMGSNAEMWMEELVLAFLVFL